MNKVIILRKCCALMFFAFCLLSQINVFAQTKAELKKAKKLFGGYWVNKKAQRHLSISFDVQDYATINDWHGKMSDDNNTIDAYKAFVENDKLVMPEDKTDLRSPYCEIIRKGNVILYRCREMESSSKKFVEETIFIREKN
jgi:hypothetical protein